MSLDLESNDQFKRSLMLHLLPTVYRLKYGLNLYNPLLNEIKTNYASYYYLALIINSSFKKYIGVNASEGEIAYVALHLSVAVQQAKRSCAGSGCLFSWSRSIKITFCKASGKTSQM